MTKHACIWKDLIEPRFAQIASEWGFVSALCEDDDDLIATFAVGIGELNTHTQFEIPRAWFDDDQWFIMDARIRTALVAAGGEGPVLISGDTATADRTPRGKPLAPLADWLKRADALLG